MRLPCLHADVNALFSPMFPPGPGSLTVTHKSLSCRYAEWLSYGVCLDFLAITVALDTHAERQTAEFIEFVEFVGFVELERKRLIETDRDSWRFIETDRDWRLVEIHRDTIETDRD